MSKIYLTLVGLALAAGCLASGVSWGQNPNPKGDLCGPGNFETISTRYSQTAQYWHADAIDPNKSILENYSSSARAAGTATFSTSCSVIDFNFQRDQYDPKGAAGVVNDIFKGDCWIQLTGSATDSPSATCHLPE